MSEAPELGWQQTLPIATRLFAENVVDDYTARGYETKGPRRADGKPDTGKRDCKCGFIVMYRKAVGPM